MTPSEKLRLAEGLRECQNMVRDFHEKHGAAIAVDPHDEIDWHAQGVRRAHHVGEEFSELMEAVATKNLKELHDGYGDLLYVVFGIGVVYDLDPMAFLEVAISNATKAATGDVRVRDKGKDYQRPDLGYIVDEWNARKVHEETL